MLEYKIPKLFYSVTDDNKKQTKGEEVGGLIINYIPPTPVLDVHTNKPLLGYTTFQNTIKNDTKIGFTIVFNFDTEDEELQKKQIKEFLDFRKRYNEWFWFEDEFSTTYKGRIVKKFDIKIPEQFEGESYYIDVELLCPCGLDGWKEKEYKKE